MRRLLLTLIVIITVASLGGCYKDIQRKKRADILVGHTWYLKKLSVNNEILTDSCYLSETMTFKKDSSGNRHFSMLCKAGAKTDLKFRWTLPGDWQFMYHYNLGGVKDSNFVFRIWANNEDSLVVGTIHNGIGIYSIYTSFP